MVSVAYLISLVCTLVAVSRAEEGTRGQGQKLEARWFGMPGAFYSGFGLGYYNPWLLNWAAGMNGVFGYGLFGGMYNVLFAKAAIESSSLARRAISLDAEHLYPRAAEKPVSCINEKGDTAQFLKSDCIHAANQLAQAKLSSATHGGCSLNLVSPKDRIAPKQISTHELHKAVDGILNACSTRRTVSKRVPASIDNQDKDVALVLSKPHA